MLALFLSTRTHRRIISLDYRGRGGSDWDPDWTHYSFGTEFADILTVLKAMDIDSAIFIGLSRGGLHALTLAGKRPGLVKALILNDVGPELNPAGLPTSPITSADCRCCATSTKPSPITSASWAPRFPAVPDDQWRFYAENSLNVTPERLRLSYDPQLARTMENFDPNAPLPDFWPQFCALEAPILALRGENSDLLTPEVHAQMAARNPRCQTSSRSGPGTRATAAGFADARADRRLRQ